MRKSPVSVRRVGARKLLGLAAVLLGLALGPALRAQNPPAAKSTNPPAKSPVPSEEAPSGEAQKPAENPPGSEALRLETPQTAPAAPQGQPAPPGATETPAAKAPGEAPRGPQGIQLETPQTPPAAPGAAPPPAAAPAEEPPQQRIIEKIFFRGNRRIPGATLRARIFSQEGDVCDENILERDFMALWNTRFLDDIRLEVTDGEKGKIVTFFVREKKLVRSIDYKGLSTVTQSDVLEEFKKRKVGLSIQSQYDPVVVKRAEVVLKEMLAIHGRQFATVRARTRNIPPNSVALAFIVVEGPKVKVGSVRFDGNTVFSDRRLERVMKLSKPLGLPPWFYWFHRGYDREKVAYDLEQVRELYRSNGYFFALAKEPQIKMTDTKRRWPFFFFSWGRGKRVDMTVPIEEGAQYRLGRFVIRGNKLLKQEQLAPFLQLKSGDTFDISKLRKAVETYTKLYGQFGYINFTATPDIEPDTKKRVINLALDFEEDKQFFLHRIEFQGNTKTRDKVIRRELLVNEGEMFNSSWWDLSVLRINQLGFFENIKKEDYEIKQNPKEGTIDVLLKVKEKGRNSIGFSGGVSGLAGNFVGLNYATNNFLGLGETLSLQFQWGTYEKLYSFGFTEPYLFDRPITTGFTIFRSDFRYDQLRQAAFYTGVNPNVLQQTPFAQFYYQNFQQNSSGFTVLASYPLRRSWARVGVTYSFSKSNLQAFSAASQTFFEALNFRGLEGPNALAGIVTSQVMPTYLYNSVDDYWNPTKGKYIYAAVAFSGSVLGGNVNTVRPIFEAKYFRPAANKKAEKPHVIGFHVLGSMVSGFGGKVAPPFSRFYTGGEEDIRGFDIRTISPVVFYPAVGQVCNRDSSGQSIPAVDARGQQATGCGSQTRFPYNTIIFPGGDTMLIANFEYRIPIAGPVTLAYFIDIGTNFIWRTSQLKVARTSLKDIVKEFPYFPLPDRLQPIGVTNFRPRSSTGLELQVILPMLNIPFRVFYGYNWLRLNHQIVPPQMLPPESVFPNHATYEDVLPYFRGFRFQERRARLGFTVARTF